MEMQKIEPNLCQQLLSELSLCHTVVGTKQLRKALQRGTANKVVLARNADPAITEPIEQMCREFHIECAWVPNMMDLGKACGIEVGAAAAAVMD